MDKKKKMKIRRHARIRAKISGTYDRPRLCVFRSNKYIYAQLVDDEFGKILAAASDIGTKKGKKGKVKTESAKEVGSLLAKAAKSKKIKEVVFDRGGFIYTGRVKSLAESARKGGLVF